MKVYILWTNYEDVHGVFTSRRRAEAARDDHFAARTYQFKSLENYSIIEMTLDAPETED